MLPQAIAASTFCFEPANKFRHHSPRQLPIIFNRLHWQSLFRTLNEEFPGSGMLSRSQHLEPSIEIIAWPATAHPGFLETCTCHITVYSSTVQFDCMWHAGRRKLLHTSWIHAKEGRHCGRIEAPTPTLCPSQSNLHYSLHHMLTLHHQNNIPLVKALMIHWSCVDLICHAVDWTKYKCRPRCCKII